MYVVVVMDTWDFFITYRIYSRSIIARQLRANTVVQFADF